MDGRERQLLRMLDGYVAEADKVAPTLQEQGDTHLRLFAGALSLLAAFPDIVFRDLVVYTLDLVAQGHVEVSVLHPLDRLTVSLDVTGHPPIVGSIPRQWRALIDRRPFGEFGNVLAFCSHIADCYNERQSLCEARGRAYAGHFLRSVQPTNPNAQERRAMQSRPLDEFLYERRAIAWQH